MCVFYFGYFSANPVKPKKTIGWSWKEAYFQYGYTACSIEMIISTRNVVNKPEGYSLEKVENINIEENEQQRVNQTPDVILILNETFYDLKMITDIETDHEYMSGIKSLDNSVHGYAVVPLPGGGTNCSEYEFLTSNSLQLMPGVTPFNVLDLKNANTDARISVKLVSEAGVGTVAAGVAKAGAQVILISGYDGGTGAAPSSSIHNAGLPWELGLAETHQTLIMNGLRNKVRIETDGKLMSGRDVAIAALLGAEEYGFATAPLVTMGCVMMRVCNLDTCPAGIATQNPELRKRFAGKPEYVENFMRFIAEELREIMAKLGCRTIDEMVGRSDLLRVREDLTDREKEIDLSKILNNPFAGPKEKVTFDPKHVYDFELEKTKDETVLLKQLSSALDKKQKRSIDVEVSNTDRSFGTIFGSEITKKYDDTLEEDTFIVKCTGAGGQSFGAFIPKGLTLELVGDSNDYFGKGLSGGKLVVYAPAGVKYKKDENIIIGNVALYGATSGKAFISGVAGERFCVRNSGASAVVEGVGDHGCEYMTGGRVVILGKTGKNFAAGMSGGIAYVLDEDNDLYTRINKEMVFSEEVGNKYDVMELKDMIKEHVALTNSEKGKEILDNFSEYLPKFKKVIPYDYNRMLMAIVQMEEKGLSSEQAQIEAFYANTRN